MSETEFAAALLNPDLPAPEGLSGAKGHPLGPRFEIYRNSVTAGLVRILEAGFPVIRKLVGPAFFAEMARFFLRDHPPRDRVLMLYGAEFPAFLQGFAPIDEYPYLPDVARMEQALRESYHAADADPITPAQLLRVPADHWAQARLCFTPALRLIRSDWPLHDIWRFQQGLGPAPVHHAQDVLILRPAFDPEPHLLPRGGGAFLSALMQGIPVETAMADLPEGFDLASMLAMLGHHGAILTVHPASSS